MKRIAIWVLSIIELFLVFIIIVLSLYKKGLLFDAPIPVVDKVYIDENNYVNIDFSIDPNGVTDKIYFLYKTDDTTPSADDENWRLLKGNNASYLLDGIYYAFFKNEDDVIVPVKDTETLGKVTSVTVSKEKIYLAVKGTYSPTFKYEKIGNVAEPAKWYSDDETIAKVDETGKITGIKKGNTKVHVEITDVEASIDVVVTNLITVAPKSFNKSKKYLPCGIYSKADNDLLDEILKDRINEAGYKTRAGVVEAARFLTLEFPYKIRYFSENGRGSTNGVDGEGRYYHVGLYLDESRYSKIGKRSAGPKTWGCSMYSRPSHGYRQNGFDCSGFISWVLLNGGFDVGDIGAGLAPHKDLTDYGKRTKFNADLVKSGKVKVGDLLSSGGVQGGHIALIVGEDKDYYYVAESLWTPPNTAVGIYTYSKKTVFNRYYYVMLMDSYYKEDGNLTKLWY